LGEVLVQVPAWMRVDLPPLMMSVREAKPAPPTDAAGTR
jgi:hypothetical protein